MRHAVHPSVAAAIIALALLLAGPLVVAQQPAKPATAPTTRYALVMPPGFEKVQAGGVTALAEAGDVEWVKKALTDLKPATRPSTMPTDIITRAKANRDSILKQMGADLALSDTSAAARFYDGELIPTLEKFRDLKPPIFFMVTTKEKLKELVRGGWGEPRFHYNKVADLEFHDENVMISTTTSMDDSVLPIYYDSTGPVEARAKSLIEGITDLDSKLQRLISDKSQDETLNMFSNHIHKTYLEPLKLKRDQRWLELGMAGWLGAKYTSVLVDVPRERIVGAMSREPFKFPISTKSLNLLKPVDEERMKPVAIPLYNRAVRIRAMQAIDAWLKDAAPDATGKVLTAIRNNPPADGETLVTLIQAMTTANLKKELSPQP